MRPRADIEQAMELHGGTVWRVCVLHFGGTVDAQDAYQNTFLKYALADSSTFEDEEHRKAWLIRVAGNACKDMLRAASRKDEPLGESATLIPAPSDPLSQPASLYSEVIDAVRALPDPPKTPLYLSLCEGYAASDIADLLDAPVNTVYSWISRGKKMLKEALS